MARQTVERYKPLLAAKAVSQQEFDLAEAKLKQAEAALSKAQLDLENTHVPAPISGRIGRAQVTEGALVGRGEATLLATIEQIDPIYANFTQPGADLLRLQQAVKSGKLKRAGVDQGRTGAGRRQHLSASRASCCFPIWRSIRAPAAFPCAPNFPIRNMNCCPACLCASASRKAVPTTASGCRSARCRPAPQGQFVMVVDAEGKAALRPVKTGGMAGGDFVIAEGLKGGEQVIVNGLQKARPGAPVKAVPWNPAGQCASSRMRLQLLKRNRGSAMFAKFFIDRPIFAWVIALIILLARRAGAAQPAGRLLSVGRAAGACPSRSTIPALRRRWWKKRPLP